MTFAPPAALGRTLAPLEVRRRRLVALLDAAVAAAYPGFLRLWRRPAARAAIIVLALLAVALVQPRTHLEWKFSHILFDYEFGFIKRGLVGELFARAVEQVTIAQFFWVFAVLYLALIAVVAAAVAALPATASPMVLLYLCLTPMLLRNVFHDWGRFDVFGLLAVWLIALALIRGWPGRLLLYAAAPLTAVTHEVNLFVVGPFALLAILILDPAGRTSRLASALALCASAGAVGALLHLYGRLDVPVDTMIAHMAGRTTDRFELPMYILTSTLSENLAERASFIAGKVLSLKFGYKLAVTVLLFAWLLPDRLRRGPVGWSLLAIALSFLPLYLVATDSYRWLALQANAGFALVVVAVAREHVTRLPRNRLYWVAASVLVPAFGV